MVVCTEKKRTMVPHLVHLPLSQHLVLGELAQLLHKVNEQPLGHLNCTRGGTKGDQGQRGKRRRWVSVRLPRKTRLRGMDLDVRFLKQKKKSTCFRHNEACLNEKRIWLDNAWLEF
jgi:hypothetical protein